MPLYYLSFRRLRGKFSVLPGRDAALETRTERRYLSRVRSGPHRILFLLSVAGFTAATLSARAQSPERVPLPGGDRRDLGEDSRSLDPGALRPDMIVLPDADETAVGQSEAEIEGRSAARVLTPLPIAPEIQVPSGVGAKDLATIENELGVETHSMERVEDLSLERRSEGYWLLPRGGGDQTRSQVRADVSRDAHVRARIIGPVTASAQFTAEAGAFSDHRPTYYRDNSGTLYDPTDDFQNRFQNRRDGAFGKLRVDARAFSALVDYDSRADDVRAGPLYAGRKRGRQGTVSARVPIGGTSAEPTWSFLPFIEGRDGSFDSAIAPYASNETRGFRTGAQVESRPSTHFFFGTNVSRESFRRTYRDANQSRFGRTYGKQIVQYSELRVPEIEFTAHAFGEVARDTLESGQSLAIASATGARAKTEGLWDTGAELSSSHRRAIGISMTGRRYALLPTPSQRFGDGALLGSSSDLPSETGIRMAAGPWWQRRWQSRGTPGDAAISLQGFSEEARNAPILVAVSPTQARTLPLGGVWTRGVELGGHMRYGQVSYFPRYVYQDAVNDSNVSWQRGQAIPGRPRFFFESAFDYGPSADEGRPRRGTHLGLVHRYRSSDAVDLGGLWTKPAAHDLGAYAGYGEGEWELRLVANNLIENRKLPGNPSFQGTAAPNLLEPTYLEREIRLQCEIIL